MDQLVFSDFSEFDNVNVGLSDMGISKNEIFICVEDFVFDEMINLQKGTEIEILDFKFYGTGNSFITFKISNLITDCNNQKILSAFKKDDFKYFIPLEILETKFERK